MKILYRILTAIFLIFLIAVSTFFLDKYVLSHYISGKNTTCYVTEHGECYHARDCQYVRNGRTKSNVYDAIEDGYRKCSVCTVGKLDVSLKHEYGTALLISAPSILLVFFTIYAIIYVRSEQKKYWEEYWIFYHRYKDAKEKFENIKSKRDRICAERQAIDQKTLDDLKEAERIFKKCELAWNYAEYESIPPTFRAYARYYFEVIKEVFTDKIFPVLLWFFLFTLPGLVFFLIKQFFLPALFTPAGIIVAIGVVVIVLIIVLTRKL